MHKIMTRGFLLLCCALFATQSIQAAESVGWTLRSLFPSRWGDRFYISLQLRHRFEYRDNFDFNTAADDQDGFQLVRTRLNLAIRPVHVLRFYVQLQDARIGESEKPATPAFQDSLDIRQAYVEFLDLGGHVSIRVGRQQIAYGDERILGGFNWSNVAQSFDGIRIRYQHKALWVDGLAIRKVKIRDGLNRWDKDDTVAGVYAGYRGYPTIHLEGYYLYRNTNRPIAFGPQGAPADLAESTLGLRIYRKPGSGFDGILETAIQRGSFGSDNIRAFAVIARMGYTFAEIPWKPRFGVEWDYGSGDGDPADGTRKTFDNLFPTNHLHYGYMDRFSLQNLNNIRWMVAAQPADNLHVALDVHFPRVATTADALYNAGRKAYRFAAQPGISKRVGTELDITAKYHANRYLTFLAGYSHFYAGRYLRSTGAADPGEFFYLQTVIQL